MHTADRRDEKLAWGIVAAWVCACFIAAWDSLPLPNIGFAQDLGVMLDAGWRFYQGQRTHADYHSPLGPVLGMLFGIPMCIGGPKYESLTLLPPVVSAITALWTCALCRGVLPAVPRAMTSLAVGAASGGIYHLGFSPEILSFAVFYNRVGFGLLAIVALAAILPRRTATPLHSRFLDCSALVATIIAFFLKANFAAVALIFVAIAAACQPRSRRDLHVAVGVAFVVLTLFLASIGFRIDRMLGDFLMAADARSDMLGNFFFPTRNTLANADVLLLMAVFSAVCVPLHALGRASWDAFGFHMAVVWLPFLAGLATTFVNSHGDGRGITPAISGVAASLAWLHCSGKTIALPMIGRSIEPCTLERPDERASTDGTLRLRACTAVTVAVATLFIVPHAQSYTRWFSVSQSIQGRQFEADPIRKLFVGSYVNNWGDNFPVLTNEGCALLQRWCSAEDGVQNIDMANHFNFACGLRSPRQSALWWDTVVCTLRRHPPPDSFADTRFLLLPKVPMARAAVEQWLKLYGTMLETEFSVCEETANFRLYKRK